MNAQKSIETALSQLLQQKPYQQLTVSEICGHAGVSRNTFYTLFDDKESLVETLFERHAFESLLSIGSLLQREQLVTLRESLLRQYYENLYAQKEYYLALVCPLQKSSDDTFMRIACRVIYAHDMKMVKASGKSIPLWEAEYIATYYSSSEAAVTQKWISEKMVVSVNDISTLVSRMVLPFWESLYTERPVCTE